YRSMSNHRRRPSEPRGAAFSSDRGALPRAGRISTLEGSRLRGLQTPCRASARLGPGSRVGQRRQDRLDLGAEVLEGRRQDERLSEVLRVLVEREPGAEGGELEENTARLAEVDRAEPETVDDR